LPNGPWLRRLLLAAVGLAVFGVVVFAVAWLRTCAGDACPSVAGLTEFDADQASKVYAADGRLITDFGLQRRTVVGLTEMSPAIPAAFLAIEDKRFYEHNGVDYYRFFGALKANLLNLSLTGQGFSTITMQLARNLWPEDIDRRERSGLRGIRRKLREAKVAMAIEARYPKDKILELYLNKINLGNRAYGVEAAAQRYFGKSARDVNVAEAAMLAALPKAPEGYNPRRRPDRALGRRNLVLDAMRDDGKLSAEDAETWKGYPIALSSRSDNSAVGEYFVEYVRQQMEAKFGSDLYRTGLRIWTTLDLNAQLAAERALTSQLEKIEAGQVNGRFPHETYREYLDKRPDDAPEVTNTPYLQGAIVVLEARTGNILAMVGGRDFADSKYNRAVQSLRQPGSTFKPILYAAALEAGIPLERVERDNPISVPMPDGQPNWEPQNYDGKFSGEPMTLREALWKSTNSVAVKIGLEIGPNAIVEEARKFGIMTRLPAVPSITLGSAEVHPIDIVSAYSVFANLGTRVEPNAILKVEDRDGRVLWEPEPITRRVLDEPIAYLINQALRGVVTNGTANAAVWRAGFQIPSGGKTGTTNDYNDVWYIGFTNDLVAGVWMGFDRNTRIMSNAQGGRLAAPAYTQMMLEIYQRRRTPGGWQEPARMLVPVEIDRSTGFRATPFCPADMREIRYFPPGGEPKEFCPLHSPFRAGEEP
jgi:penicillin-binding protein 1A